jgi:putative PIN family toxin of toxin-antitoxin system
MIPPRLRRSERFRLYWVFGSENSFPVTPPLQEILDQVGSRAKARGLTPEILDSLLKGA